MATSIEAAVPLATALATKAVVALAFWIGGRWLIHFVVSMVKKNMTKREVEPTLTRYLVSVINVTLNIVLAVGILGYLGIQTTTFAAVIAAAGVAVGMAWSGLLANFAAGVFLIILRPFKTGDFITAGGVTGTVTEIGLFATTINTPDNVQTIVGNNKLFSDNIQNFSTNAYRRVELKAQLAGNTDPAAAALVLFEAIKRIPNVLENPAPEIEILEFTLVGPVLAVRPFTNNEFYWQVYFDTNRAIRDSLKAAGFDAPMPAQAVVISPPAQAQP